jgi:flavin-dependent dehydrogenase
MNVPDHSHVSEGVTPPTDALIPILEGLSAGEIYRSIAEDDYSYKVIRLKEKKDKKYQVEAITVHKRPFDEWFRKEAEKIRIEILDADLRRSLDEKYPNLWWLSIR